MIPSPTTINMSIKNPNPIKIIDDTALLVCNIEASSKIIFLFCLVWGMKRKDMHYLEQKYFHYIFFHTFTMQQVLLFILLIATATAFRSPARLLKRTVVAAIPLELTGQLDETKSWPVKYMFDGQEKTVDVPESMSLLEFAETIFEDVPFSCRNGICITCAAKIESGRENTLLAVSGMGEPQLDAGFVCSCQCFVKGPGVTVRLNQYEEAYEMQVT
jgi:ferredoxin